MSWLPSVAAVLKAALWIIGGCVMVISLSTPTAVIEAETAGTKKDLTTQVEEKDQVQKAAEEKCAEPEAGTAQRAVAGPDAVGNLEAKHDASAQPLADMKELDTDPHEAISHLEDVHITKDNIIKELKARIRDLTPALSSRDENLPPDTQGLDKLPHQPAVTLPAQHSGPIAADGTNKDDDASQYSLKGSAGERKIVGSEDARAKYDGSNAKSTSSERTNEAGRPVICQKCRNHHEGPCRARYRAKNSEKDSNRRRCPHCKKIHRGVCRFAPVEPKPCGNLDGPTSTLASRIADSFLRQQEGWSK